jgi:hypothetical protein
MMSLAALIAPGEEGLWRTGFIALGVVGAAESLMLAGKHAPPGRDAVWLGADLLSVVLYALAALQGAWIGLPDDLGLGLRPLEVEGILVSLLLLLGVGLAGALFVTSAPRT